MSVKVKIKKRLGNFQLNVQIESQDNRIGVLGASGCGKSMTLKCIAGIETPDQGSIVVNEKVLFDQRLKINQKPQRRRIGYLFQNYALFPTMSVEKNIAAGLTGNKDENRIRVNQMVDKFQLHGLRDHYPFELSGGQQQRVALARIMAYEPEVILLDEPFSALDEMLKESLQQEMMEMLREYKGTVILVSHNRDEIFRFSNELLFINQGESICFGKTKEYFVDPQWKEAAILTGCKNIVPIIRIDAHQLRVPEWETTLYSSREIRPDARFLGIRAHEFLPIWGETQSNCIPIKLKSIAETPFERKYLLNGGYDDHSCIYWFLQKDKWRQIDDREFPNYLKIPEEQMMFLK